MIHMRSGSTNNTTESIRGKRDEQHTFASENVRKASKQEKEASGRNSLCSTYPGLLTRRKVKVWNQCRNRDLLYVCKLLDDKLKSPPFRGVRWSTVRKQ